MEVVPQPCSKIAPARTGEANRGFNFPRPADGARNAHGMFSHTPMEARRELSSEFWDKTSLGLTRHRVPGEKKNMGSAYFHYISPAYRIFSIHEHDMLKKECKTGRRQNQPEFY
jgi:hypothetical protein